MRQFVGLIKSISVGSLSIFYSLVGILAALTSAIIEYKVLEQFLTFGDGNEASYALILVVVLEGAKYSLYFYIHGFDKEYTGINEEVRRKKKKFLTGTKWILIVFSAFCSLVFFTNCFYGDTENAHDLGQRIEESLTSDLESIEAKYESLKMEESNYYDKRIENEQKIIDGSSDYLSTPSNKKSADEANERISTSQQNIDNLKEDKKEKLAELEAEKLEAKANCKESYEKGGENYEAVKKDISYDTSGDNIYISKFLSSFSQTFSGYGYSRIAYFVTTFAICVAVSVVLEVVINFSQYLSSLDTKTFCKLLPEIDPIETSVFNTTNSVLLSSFIFLVCRTWLGIAGELKRPVFFTVVLTYILVVFIGNRTSGIRVSLFESEKSVPKKINSFASWAVKLIVPNALSVVLYLILGYIFYQKIEFENLTTLAIAIGGSFAHLKNENYTSI